MIQTHFCWSLSGTLAFLRESSTVLASANRVCLSLRSQPLAAILGRFSSSSLPPSFRSGALRRRFFSQAVRTPWPKVGHVR
jgi:hypothetical protein